MDESRSPKRKELLNQLQQVPFCAAPTVVTFDMGLQYDCICPKGAGTGLGNILSWPVYRFRKIEQSKWKTIIINIRNRTLSLDDLSETDLYEFVKDTLLSTDKVGEDDCFADALDGLLLFPENFSDDFYCLFDDIDWDYEKPEFYETKEAVISAFEEKYSTYAEWDTMDDEKLEEWLVRSKDDLAEFPFILLNE